MEIQILSTIGPCTEAIIDGTKQEISVVISPLKINSDEKNIKVISGCNMWKACQNKHCQYSLLARDNTKKI